MAAKDRDESSSFLARWSQRKQEAAEGATDPEAVAPQPAPEPAAEEPVDVSALPDIDSMDADADFSVFMRKGVPEALKRRALRRLWKVDPVFHEICMLDDYNLDYTDAAMVVPNLKTVYQVGRGMVSPDEEPEQQAGIADTPAPDTTGAAAPAASPALPDAENAVGAETPPDTGGAELPAPPAGAAESAQPEEIRDHAAPAPAMQDAPRSARRRRWGDNDV